MQIAAIHIRIVNFGMKTCTHTGDQPSTKCFAHLVLHYRESSVEVLLRRLFFFLDETREGNQPLGDLSSKRLRSLIRLSQSWNHFRTVHRSPPRLESMTDISLRASTKPYRCPTSHYCVSFEWLWLIIWIKSKLKFNLNWIKITVKSNVIHTN